MCCNCHNNGHFASTDGDCHGHSNNDHDHVYNDDDYNKQLINDYVSAVSARYVYHVRSSISVYRHLCRMSLRKRILLFVCRILRMGMYCHGYSYIDRYIVMTSAGV